MVSDEHYNAEPLYVSLSGRLKENDSWVIFDHYQFVDDQLFLIGLDMEDRVIRVLSEQVHFTDNNLEYSFTFLQKQAKGMNDALEAFKKINHIKENGK